MVCVCDGVCAVVMDVSVIVCVCVIVCMCVRWCVRVCVLCVCVCGERGWVITSLTDRLQPCRQFSRKVPPQNLFLYGLISNSETMKDFCTCGECIPGILPLAEKVANNAALSLVESTKAAQVNIVIYHATLIYLGLKHASCHVPYVTSCS